MQLTSAAREALPGGKTQDRLSTRSRAVFEKFAQDIASGHQIAGRQLPKYKYFAAKEHISESTVAEVMACLAEQGFIHKEGKSWIVGSIPASGASSGSHYYSYPAVMLLVPTHTEWNSCLNDWPTRAVHTGFHAALQSSGISSVKVSALPFPSGISDTFNTLGTFHFGRESAEKDIRRLGPNYMGALVSWGQNSRIIDKDFKDWIAWLLKVGKPVIYLDCWQFPYPKGLIDELDAFSGGRKSLFFRCIWDDRKIVELIVRTLRERGHRRIGAIVPADYHRTVWARQRIRLIENQCSVDDIFLQVIVDRQIRFDDEDGMQLEAIVGKFRRNVGRGEKTKSAALPCGRADISRQTQELNESIHTHKLTALVAINDPVALNPT